MKKLTIFCTCCLVTFFSTAAVYAQTGGFTGPSQASAGFTGPTQTGTFPPINVTNSGQIQAMTVAQVQTFPHDAPVILTGNIIRSNGRELYTFRDSTGEITINVGDRTFGGLSVGASDRVVISGHIRLNRGGQVVEIDVKLLMKT